MKRIILIILINVLSLNAFSQVAGYLGKKIMVGYNFNFNPVTSIFNGGFYNTGPVFLVMKHEGYAGFTFSKKASVIAGYISQNTNLRYPYNNSSNIIFAESSSFKKYNKINSSVIDFGFRFHLGKFVSPVGTYVDFTYGICKMQYSDEDPYVYYEFYDYNNYNYVNGRYDGTGSYIKYKRISIGVGNTKVIKDRFVFNVGLKLNLHHKYEYYKNPAIQESSREILILLQDFNKSANWLEAKIGFGILF